MSDRHREGLKFTLLLLTGLIPSQHLRKFIYTTVFGMHFNRHRHHL